MVPDDLAKRRQQHAARALQVAAGGHVLAARADEPQRAVHVVVFEGLSGLGKDVRNHSSVESLGEGSQNVARIVEPAGGETKTRQRDHRVAAPIGEPRISRDDRPAAALALDHVGIGGQRQPLVEGRDAAVRGRNDLPPPLALGSLEGAHVRPGGAIDRSHDENGSAGRQLEAQDIVRRRRRGPEPARGAGSMARDRSTRRRGQQECREARRVATDHAAQYSSGARGAQSRGGPVAAWRATCGPARA